MTHHPEHPCRTRDQSQTGLCKFVVQTPFECSDDARLAGVVQAQHQQYKLPSKAEKWGKLGQPEGEPTWLEPHPGGSSRRPWEGSRKGMPSDAGPWGPSLFHLLTASLIAFLLTRRPPSFAPERGWVSGCCQGRRSDAPARFSESPQGASITGDRQTSVSSIEERGAQHLASLTQSQRY